MNRLPNERVHWRVVAVIIVQNRIYYAIYHIDRDMFLEKKTKWTTIEKVHQGYSKKNG